MGCVDLGELRAYCDGELTPSKSVKLEMHVAECASCRAQLGEVRQTSLMVWAKLSMLAPSDKESPQGVAMSLATLKTKLVPESDRQSELGWIGSLAVGAGYQWRAMAAGLAAVVVLATFLALPPMRSMAGDLLAIFRVQKFTPVAVDTATLANIPMLDPQMAGTFEGLTQAPTITSGLSSVEVAAKVDFPARLPARLPAGVAADPRLSVMNAFDFGYTFDLARAEAYLTSLGIKGVSLPKTPDGKKISAAFPTRLIAEYGGSDGKSPVLMLVEGRSPSLEIPAGVDAEEVRNAILGFPGLPPELVAQLRAIDWKTTAPVPVMKGDSSRQLLVDGGADGLLIQNSAHKVNALLWQKQDVVYILTGQVSEAELIAAANSMR